jgi:hypothetical protein
VELKADEVVSVGSRNPMTLLSIPDWEPKGGQLLFEIEFVHHAPFSGAKPAPTGPCESLEPERTVSLPEISPGKAL